MKFKDSKADLYESMIGHFYKSRNILGNPIIQIVGYGYNLKKKSIFSILLDLHILDITAWIVIILKRN